MVRMRNLVKVGNREVKKRYIGNKLIFEDLGDKTEVLSGTEIFTDKADDSVVHVEIDGKSYQGGVPTPDHPIEINSLNDFDVVSQKSEGGRNLLLNSGEEVKNNNYLVKAYSPSTPLDEGEEYTMTICATTARGVSVIIPILSTGYTSQTRFSFNGTHKQIVTRTFKASYYQGRRPEDGLQHANLNLYRFPNDGSVTGATTIHWVKVEKGNTATDWTPAPEDIIENDNHPLIDKINLSLSEPLRSVGDVKDRLFRDSDGLWKVERNVELIHPEDGTRTIEETYGVLDSPFYEIFSQDDQDKLSNLRSFEDSNYVYTIVNDKTDTLSDYIADNLKPTLHTIFKSKGWYDYYQKTLLK